jgi:predicted 3-demethylubiquinone-9 3-methyltransferase (glyoxalase superfamily)
MFDNFFIFEPSSLINDKGYKENYPHENTTKIENISYNINENNPMGLDNTVITVTPVTNENKLDKQIEYDQENECNKAKNNNNVKVIGFH